jgi:hypothetical protein
VIGDLPFENLQDGDGVDDEASVADNNAVDDMNAIDEANNDMGGVETDDTVEGVETETLGVRYENDDETQGVSYGDEGDYTLEEWKKTLMIMMFKTSVVLVKSQE